MNLPLNANTTPDDMVMRYLATFGPASYRDVQFWSELTDQGDRLLTFVEETATNREIEVVSSS